MFPALVAKIGCAVHEGVAPPSRGVGGGIGFPRFVEGPATLDGERVDRHRSRTETASLFQVDLDETIAQIDAAVSRIATT